jgi:hypothetical protein
MRTRIQMTEADLQEAIALWLAAMNLAPAGHATITQTQGDRPWDSPMVAATVEAKPIEERASNHRTVDITLDHLLDIDALVVTHMNDHPGKPIPLDLGDGDIGPWVGIAWERRLAANGSPERITLSVTRAQTLGPDPDPATLAMRP